MTATREELLSLIGRLEEATEPSRELDWHFAYIIGVGVDKERRLFAELGEGAFRHDEQGLSPYDRARGDHVRNVWQSGTRYKRGGYVPQIWRACDGPSPLLMCLRYTALLDAAAPGESIRKVERRRFDSGKVYWVAVQDADGDGCGFEGHGATEALARRIACLKARAKLMESTP